MSKFFKWFVIILLLIPLATIIINLFSFERTYDFVHFVNGDNGSFRETYKEYFDIHFANYFSSSYKDLFDTVDWVSLSNWQESYFIPGFHNASTQLASTFFPSAIDLNDMVYPLPGIGYCFMYNLLPCVLLITCFGTISWIFKLWN